MTSKILLGWNILKYFPSETTRPGCIANNHFVYKRSVIVETNVQKVYITLNPQSSGERSRPYGPLVLHRYLVRGRHRQQNYTF